MRMATAVVAQPATAGNDIVGNAQLLWEKKQLPSPQQLRDWMQQPSGGFLQLPQPSSKPLPVREVARRATASHVRIGWVYQCNRCANWHTNLAGGYAITSDTVATARHILVRPDRMKGDTGYPIAVRGENEVLVISGVLGADTDADTALLRVKTNDLTPLPLNPEVEVGDTVYCLSAPTGELGYFSNGIVNRFATEPGVKPPNPLSKRLNVSTDWAPGSSGSAVLDSCGNAIGHVGSITAIQSQPKGNEAPSHYMNLHWAVPAGNVLHLANPRDNVK
jgi:S1-C subfamily serine protease